MPHYNGLHVPAAVDREVTRMTAEHLEHGTRFPPTHRYAGTDSSRARVGKPGHCEPCAVVGHVAAHPDFGCGDVGCTADH